MKKVVLIIFVFYSVFANAQNSKIDSLKNHIATAKKDSLLVGSIHALVWTYIEKADYSEAEKTAKKMIELCQSLNFNSGLAKAYNNMGVVFYYQNIYPKTLDYYYKALSIYEKINNLNRVNMVLRNISLVYMDTHEEKKAEEVINRSVEYSKSKNDLPGLGQAYELLGMIKSKHNETLEEGKEYYNKALNIYKQLDDKYSYSATLDNIGNVYYRSGEFQKAIDYYNLSLPYYLKEGHAQDYVNAYGNIGSCLQMLKKYDEAEKYLKMSLKMTDSLNLNSHSIAARLNLSSLFENKGDYKKALQYYKLYNSKKDSIFNDENKKELMRHEINYEFEKKEALAKVEQEKKEAIAQQEKQKQQIILIAVALGLLTVIVFSFFLYKRFKTTQKQKTIIENQKHEVESQKEIIQEKNKEIIDSINYAKRLQEAILPPQKLVKTFLPESFTLYKPKDIVAGDFYWMETSKDWVMFAAADCTGHGVPGALVSVVCSNALNRTVKEFGLLEPGKILDKVRELVIETFEKSENEVKDGMDISLCAMNIKTKQILWAGANNPLWIIRNVPTSLAENKKELIELKPDKQPIGIFDGFKPFETHSFEPVAGDSIFIFTDGYADQFGGPKGKKFKYNQLKELLISISDKAMEEQKIILENKFNQWKDNLEQVDDVLIIGVKI